MNVQELVGLNAVAGAVIYLLLACQYAVILRRSGFIFLPGFLFGAVWSLGWANLVLDMLHAAIWSASFLTLIGLGAKSHPKGWYLLWLVPVICLVTILAAPRVPDQALFYLFTVSCIGALFVAEQLVRNQGGLIKAVGVGVGALFFYDLYVYTSKLIEGAVDLDTLQARGLANTAVGVCLLFAPLFIKHEESQRRRLGFSRPLVITTTSIVIAGLLLTFTSVLAFLVRLGGDEVSQISQPFFLFLAILGIGFVLSSSTRRAQVRVWINKVFFRTKYDYNVEWRNLSERLTPRPGQDFCETATCALLPVFQGTGGVLYLREGEFYVPRYSHNTNDRPNPLNAAENEAFLAPMAQRGWVYAPPRSDPPMSDGNDAIPRNILEQADLQLIVPLRTPDSLLGFITLSGPTSVAANLDWEDLDFLRMVSLQISNFVAYQMLSDEVVIARQFDAFHQFTTFVVHDLKNLIAQQALVVENATRFIDNPEFVADAIKTIDNSVRKMTWMLSKLSQKSLRDIENAKMTRVSLPRAIETAIDRCKNRSPLPEFKPRVMELDIEADEENLIMALTHLMTNAQEACKPDDRVDVLLMAQDNLAVIQIIDSGCGMDEAFIRDRLFKPFDSTKKNQGMGVGAYQCKQILSKMSGQISVSSQPGEGTCFSITLPAVKARDEVS